MARITEDDFSGQTDGSTENTVKIDAEGQNSIEVPSNEFIADSDISREGQDLVLETPDGDTLIVTNYFSTDPAPILESPDGSVLTENLVNSFLNSSSQYAQASSMTDESPVGAVEEISGEATVIHTDGTTEQITLGTPIYKGDTIETSADGAVNIVFIDETSMAVSENARLSVDEYEFDPSTESGETNLSVLRGVFVFTSGLIGRDDPDDVLIDTPVGSIGIRGTIIAGKIQPGADSEITVVEGAIVVTNGVMETTLSTQYETIRLGGFNDNMQDLGVKGAEDVGKTYGSVSDVVPKLFSSINDSEQESTNNAAEEAKAAEEAQAEENLENEEVAPEETLEQEAQDPISEQTLDPTFENNDLGLNTDGYKAPVAKQSTTEGRENIGYHKGGKNGAEFDDTIYYNQGTGPDAPTFHFRPEALFEDSQMGDLVAKISIGNAPAGVVFTLSGAGAINFDIVDINNGVAEIKVSSTGAGSTNTTVGTNLGATLLTATFANGQTFNWNIPSVVQDASVHIGSAGGLDYDVDSLGAITTVQKIGDFNGDGTTDSIVGSPNAAAGNGLVNIINGATNTPLQTFPGAGGNFGHAVAGVGDLNNDGFADVVAGAPNTANGTAFLIEGTNSVATTVGTNGSAGGDKYGHAITGLGDFDGADGGKSDYAVSALNANAGGSDRGEVYIHTNDGATMTTISGHQDNMRLGEHISGLGDINGDGLSDLMISAQGTVLGNHEAYIVHGGATNSDTSGLAKISTPHDIIALGAAGDINGDGFDDFAVSLDDGTNINTYVVFGAASQTANMNLAWLEDRDNALKINHSGASGSEYEINAVGDVDGDGFDDIQVGIVGGNQYVIHGDLGGNAVPYATDQSASDGNGNVGEIGATANNQSLVGNVDFFDNTHTNLSMKGGSGNNIFNITNASFKNIDGGKGMDILHFDGVGLDFTNVDFEHVSQIEKIQLSQSTTSTLTVENIFNMLKSSDNGSLTIELADGASSSNLDINAGGSATVADALNEEGEGATLAGSAGGYDHYTVGGYDLYIEQTIVTNVV